MEEGNHPENLVDMINLVKDEGIDIINVSSGGVVPASIDIYPGYQIPFAEIIKKVLVCQLSPEVGYRAKYGGRNPENNRADLIF